MKSTLITREHLFEILKLEVQNESFAKKNQVSFVRTPKGPGQLVKYGLLEDHPNSFLLPRVQVEEEKRLKFILSIPKKYLYFFGEGRGKKLNPFYDFLCALVQYADVTIWGGSNQLFSTHKPCKTAYEAVDLLQKQDGEDEAQQIVQALNTQGIASHEYIIIDANRIKEIYDELQEERYFYSCREPEKSYDLHDADPDQYSWKSMEKKLDQLKHVRILNIRHFRTRAMLKKYHLFPEKLIKWFQGITNVTIDGFVSEHPNPTTWKEFERCLVTLFPDLEKLHIQFNDDLFNYDLDKLFSKTIYHTFSLLSLSKLKKLTVYHRASFLTVETVSQPLFFEIGKKENPHLVVEYFSYLDKMINRMDVNKTIWRHVESSEPIIFSLEKRKIPSGYLPVEEPHIDPRIFNFLELPAASRIEEKRAVFVEQLTFEITNTRVTEYDMGLFPNLKMLHIQATDADITLDLRSNDQLRELFIDSPSPWENGVMKDISIRILNRSSQCIEVLKVKNTARRSVNLTFSEPLDHLRELNVNGRCAIENTEQIFSNSPLQYGYLNVMVAGSNGIFSSISHNKFFYFCFFDEFFRERNISTYVLHFESSTNLFIYHLANQAKVCLLQINEIDDKTKKSSDDKTKKRSIEVFDSNVSSLVIDGNLKNVHTKFEAVTAKEIIIDYRTFVKPVYRESPMALHECQIDEMAFRNLGRFVQPVFGDSYRDQVKEFNVSSESVLLEKAVKTPPFEFSGQGSSDAPSVETLQKKTKKEFDLNFSQRGAVFSGNMHASFYPKRKHAQIIGTVIPWCVYKKRKFDFLEEAENQKDSLKYGWIEFVTPKNFRMVSNDDAAFQSELVQVMQCSDHDASLQSGYMTVQNAEKNKWTPVLLQDILNDKNDLQSIVFIASEKVNVKWKWNVLASQWSFQLDKKIQSLRVVFSYRIPTLAYAETPPYWIDPAILTELKQKLKKENLLPFLFDDTKSTSEKLKELISFLKNLKPFNETLKPDSRVKTDVDKLIFAIKNKTGVCRHRAALFFFLSALIGVQSRMVDNFRDHEWVHYVENKIWKVCNFGGGDYSFEEDLTKKEDEFEAIHKLISVPPDTTAGIQPSVLTTHSFLAKQKNSSWNQYFDFFSRYEKPFELHDPVELFQKQQKSPLICFTDVNDPERFVSWLYSIKKPGFRYCYIDYPQDLITFFEGKKVGESGELVSYKGVIQEAMEDASTKTCLVINANLFSSSDLGDYHELIEFKAPMLHGKLLPAHLHVAWVTCDERRLRANTAFASRCRFGVLDDALKQQVARYQVPARSSSQSRSIDLCRNPLWRDDFFGDIEFKKGRASIKNTVFLDSIKTAGEMVIFNSPEDDPAFDSCQRHIRVTGQCFDPARGTFVSVSAAIQVKKSDFRELPSVERVRVSIREKTLQDKIPIHLSILNWHTLKEELLIENGLLDTRFNVLKRYDDEKHVFSVHGIIPREFWMGFLDDVENNPEYKEKFYTFYLEEGASIESVMSHPVLSDQKKQELTFAEYKNTTHQMIVSSDYFLMLETLKKQYPEAFFTPVSLFTSQAELLYFIQKKKGLEFECVISKILQDLLDPAKKTVVLYGELSIDTYYFLHPILNGEKQIMINGELHVLHGKLIWNTSENMMAYLNPKSYDHVNIDKKDYQSVLGLSDETFKKINLFYERVNEMKQSKSISVQSLNYLVYLNFKNVITRPIGHQLKQVFHYQLNKNSVEYAYFSVFSKCLFYENDARPTRDRALTKWIDHGRLEWSIKRHFWFVLNCFRGKQLKEWLGKNDPFMKIDAEPSDELIGKIKLGVTLATLFLSKEKTNKTEVFQKKLLGWLHDPMRSILFLKGAPGVGKTHQFRALNKDFEVFDGEDAIKIWLKSKPANHRPHVLFLDEMNFKRDHYYDFLYALAVARILAPSSEIIPFLYEGEPYEITRDHKVAATGNPEYFPARFHHQLFETAGETFYLEPSDEHSLKTIIQHKWVDLLQKNPLINDAELDLLMQLHALAISINRTYFYSIRDVEHLVSCFLEVKKSKLDMNTTLHILALECYAGTFFEEDKRHIFLQEIEIKYGVLPDSIFPRHGKSVIALSKNYAVSDEFKAIYLACEHVLTMCKNEILSGEVMAFKHGVMIEGDTGLGKTRFFRNLLKAKGFTRYTEGSTAKNVYHEINVKAAKNENEIDSRIEKTIRWAAKNHQPVIINEINLNKKLEALVNQLPGLIVFCSQNAGSYEGRDAQSAALKNRLQVFSQKSFSRDGMISMARFNKIDDPENFVDAFFMKQTVHPDIFVMRLFFDAMRDWKNEKKLAPRI